jgi:CrcB protein
VVGAFVLGGVVVLATDVLAPTSLFRPLVGAGFCGALTTFASVVVDADRLVAHGHAGSAAAYLLLSIVAGIAAAALGLVAARRLARRVA